jgi:hypothetical protein
MQSTSGASQSRLPIVMVAIAIVLALIGIVGIASGWTDKPSKNLSSTGATTTTDPSGGFGGGDGGDTGGDSSGTTLSTLAGGSGVTTTPTTVKGATGTTVKASAACPEAPATATDPGPHTPPAVGRYTFVSCTDSSDTLETTITAGASSNGVTRRNVNQNLGGSQQTSSVAYGPNGVTIESLSFDTPQGRMTCDLNPDVQNYPADMHVGATWSSSSSCDIKSSAGAKFGTLKLDTTGKVSGKVSTSIAGPAINAWVVDGTITITATIPSFGTQKSHVSEHGYYDPAHGIELYRHTEATSEGGSGEKIVRDDKLTSLTPKPAS